MTRPWRAMLRLAPLLVATSPGVAQAESMAVMGGLTVTESIGWPSSHRVFRGGAKCDAEGNVFFIPQPLMTFPEKGRYATTFVRVSRDGSKATTSSNRIAAIYFGRTADEPDASWVDIYDASAGIRIATYGPIPRLVMCYLQDGLRDRFILLGGEAEVRMSQASGR